MADVVVIYEESFVNSDTVIVVHGSSLYNLSVRPIVEGWARPDIVRDALPWGAGTTRVTLDGYYSGRMQICTHTGAFPTGHISYDIQEMLQQHGDLNDPFAVRSLLDSYAAEQDLIYHEADLSNPHSVTAVQVGRDIVQWNADRIAGVPVDGSAASDGYLLQYDASDGYLRYALAEFFFADYDSASGAQSTSSTTAQDAGISVIAPVDGNYIVLFESEVKAENNAEMAISLSTPNTTLENSDSVRVIGGKVRASAVTMQAYISLSVGDEITALFRKESGPRSAYIYNRSIFLQRIG